MKKRKAVKSHKTHRSRSTSRGGVEVKYFGLSEDFILIFGGGFLVIVLGLMILFR